jgi:hypothetical protein
MYFITNFLVSRDHVLTLHSQSPQSREYSEVKKRTRCGKQAGPLVLLPALPLTSPLQVRPPLPCRSLGGSSGRPGLVIELCHLSALAGMWLLCLITPHRICLLLVLHLLRRHATAGRLGLWRLVSMVFVIKLCESASVPPSHFSCCDLCVEIRGHLVRWVVAHVFYGKS